MGHERTPVTTIDQLRALVPEPIPRIRDKAKSELHEVHRLFLAAARLYFVATSGAAGDLDVSPKGDPAGGVLILDDRTTARSRCPTGPATAASTGCGTCCRTRTSRSSS
ncbi:hypothetical protein [Tsukamurella sp. NPDC003166]|uniref:hypothetical protein n=1 Tax=Tsukamurella sp. NPDC003166 TaxID=3154444 RepID=UPI0033B5DF1F